MFSKCAFYVIKLKRSMLTIIFLCFTIGLLIFSNSNLPAVKNGLTLWATSVVPSLFPFFVATELLMYTNIISILGRLLNPIMKPLFNIRGEGSFAFIMGIISGYPMGAKIACNFRKNNICSKEECERLLSFTNNSGPLFIVGTIGILMFGNTSIGILLFITHILACITVGILFRFWKCNKRYSRFANDFKTPTDTVTFSNLGEILATSITNSISTIFLIGGFVVIFSTIISIIKSSGLLEALGFALTPLANFLNIDISFIQAFFTGLLEITNGINSISMISCKKLSINIVLTSFILGLGGLSVFLQILSITSKTDLSIKPYIIGKMLQATFSSIYTYIFINFVPFFNFDL